MPRSPLHGQSRANPASREDPPGVGGGIAPPVRFRAAGGAGIRSPDRRPRSPATRPGIRPVILAAATGGRDLLTRLSAWQDHSQQLLRLAPELRSRSARTLPAPMTKEGSSEHDREGASPSGCADLTRGGGLSGTDNPVPGWRRPVRNILTVYRS